MAYTSFADLLQAAEEHGTLAAASLQLESAERQSEPAVLRERMRETLAVMRTAVEDGRATSALSRSGLTGGAAVRVSSASPGPTGPLFSDALASALAVGEVNASMGRIVAAPTGGASGVLPGVLFALARHTSADDEALIDALFTAGAIGGIIAARASLAGAIGGCQAEIGSAAAMAAAAGVEMLGGSPEASGHGGSLALQGLLGLVCDPVGGLVEVPCVARNATGSAVALAGVELALAGVTFPIPFDEVVDAAASVGRSLPPSLRETALGGLAATPTAHRLVTTLRPRREA